ncbi:MAG: DUF2786 domain-containing protein, partial [Spirochaetales bacterium]|nr:DUF2786 domain-containing protein [Candidatus Physcosoma equi]
YQTYGCRATLYDAFFFAPPLQKTNLGRFESEGRLIILSEELLEEPFPVVQNIFLHELAHALDYALHGSCSGHSPLFREYCAVLGVEEGFEKAKVKNALRSQKDLSRKVEKLLALTSSPFENEALEALSKAQKLIAKGALEEKEENRKKDERIYTVDLYEAGRTPLYCVWLMSFTGSATGCFLVKCQGELGGKVTRAYGTLEQVEAALYLFDYLTSSLEDEIKRLKKEGHAITKDSFVMGAVPEMRKKLEGMDRESSTALVVLQNDNAKKAKKLVFSGQHLRSTRSTGHVGSTESYRLGAKFGQNLDISRHKDTKKLN